jgi:hypothetical protein
MSYLGKTPNFGVRQRYYFTATGGETSLSGADDNGVILIFTDGAYVDVYLNGILLVAGTDYNTTTTNTISSLTALAASDIVEIVVYDVFSVADTVSASAGGTFNANVTVNGTTTLTGGGTGSIHVNIEDSSLCPTMTFTRNGSGTTTNGFVKFENSVGQVAEINATGGGYFLDNVGIGTSSPADKLHVFTGSSGVSSFASNTDVIIEDNGNTSLQFASPNTSNNQILFSDPESNVAGVIQYSHSTDAMSFNTNGSERMRIDSSGNVLMNTTDTSPATNNVAGVSIRNGSRSEFSNDGGVVVYVNRLQDGTLMSFRSAGTGEGSVSVSGSTVSYNGGHLSRWSRLADDSKDTSIVKGTVMTNLDEMVEWSHETTYWTDEDELPVDEDGNPTVSVGDVKTAAYVEDNEQLNKMAVSSVEGDANVAGVFVNWDNDDDEFNDMNIAMTGDMVIRIASGTTVARGDLLMSAGDGTAKPQGDDIVRNKTIAKVTSTHVSHTYDDGSYLVPCVLMAC